MTPLEAAYAAYEPGSAGFLAAVDFVGRYQATKSARPRPGASHWSPKPRRGPWERTWKDESWWRDGEDTGEWCGPQRECNIKIFPTHIPLRRQKAAISAATVPPFRPETGKIDPLGGGAGATAVWSSNGAN